MPLEIKQYDDMDNSIVLSQTGTKKSKCKSCRDGSEEALVDHLIINVRVVASCQTVELNESDPVAYRKRMKVLSELKKEFTLNALSVDNFKKFLAMIAWANIELTNPDDERKMLESLSMKDLKKMAADHGIKGRSRKDLVNSLIGK